MTGLAGDMLSGIALWVTRRERERERDDDALRALLTALNTTKRYIARLEGLEGGDTDTEAELVRLWQEAAVRIRRTDNELGQRLQMKADYWTNPSHWSDEDIRTNGIQIDQVSSDAQKILADV
ncbi:MAG: hypothetical protein GXP28_12015 [Planctomycetes bacterium]|nr:hypothetical protein [Planctomycetota bacterium]